jgi:hypothetical protein
MFKMIRRSVVTHPEEVVRQYALRRLATVFRVPESSLTSDMRFGHELKAAPASDFKANEFDLIDDDIKSVADRQILKEMSRGDLVIQTVGDYCIHMVRCSSLKPRDVASVLRIPVPE